MDVFNSFVEWFNGLVGLQYAGYGPITAIFIGILTVMLSIKALKFFFKPFVPLFQTAQQLGEANPVLAQQGIRHSQLMDQNGAHTVSTLVNRSRERAGAAYGRFTGSDHEDLPAAANDAEEMDFADALEEAWQHDQSAELREEIAPLRPSRASDARAGKDRAKLKSALSDLRPTAAATPVAKAAEAVPLVCITNFGNTSRSCGAAHRIALRLRQGVSETLARIPGLAVETSEAADWKDACQSSGPTYAVEGHVELKDGGVHVAIAVRSSTDGAHLLARDLTCSPADLQKFEREVALEIASAVIAQQRPSGRSIMSRLISSRGARSGSTYPNARHPSPEHLHRIDQPAQ